MSEVAGKRGSEPEIMFNSYTVHGITTHLRVAGGAEVPSLARKMALRFSGVK